MNGHLKMMLVAAWGLSLVLCGLTTSGASAVGVTETAPAAESAPRMYKVELSKLCRTRGIKTRALKCRSGYSSSSGTLQRYQAVVEADKRAIEAQNSTCKSLALAFWGNGADSYKVSLVTTSGTRTVRSRNTETKIIRGDFSGPFRLNTSDRGGGHNLYLSGYAMCTTRDGTR